MKYKNAPLILGTVLIVGIGSTGLFFSSAYAREEIAEQLGGSLAVNETQLPDLLETVLPSGEAETASYDDTEQFEYVETAADIEATLPQEEITETIAAELESVRAEEEDFGAEEIRWVRATVSDLVFLYRGATVVVNGDIFREEDTEGYQNRTVESAVEAIRLVLQDERVRDFDLDLASCTIKMGKQQEETFGNEFALFFCQGSRVVVSANVDLDEQRLLFLWWDVQFAAYMEESDTMILPQTITPAKEEQLALYLEFLPMAEKIVKKEFGQELAADAAQPQDDRFFRSLSVNGYVELNYPLADGSHMVLYFNAVHHSWNGFSLWRSELEG